MKIKAEKLESIINDEIKFILSSMCAETSFAIYIEEDIEVQVKITRDKGDFFDEVLPEYRD